MSLQDRHAIITGAGQGLGACIAEHYVAAGASVLLCARNQDRLQFVGQKLSDGLVGGQQLLIQQTDVSNPAEVNALVETALAAFPKLDILINNAGVYGPMGPLDETDWAEWVEAIHINLIGSAYVCRAVVPHFKGRRYGKIVNLSGGGAAGPLPRFTAYAASKAAIVRFTESLALEVKEFNIDVNAIAPGVLATRLMDQVIEAGPDKVGSAYYERMAQIKKRGGAPLDKAAALAVYLGSAASDGISGKLISAVWDPWPKLHEHKEDLDDSDIYTLRRIVPKERDKDWGDL